MSEDLPLLIGLQKLDLEIDETLKKKEVALEGVQKIKDKENL